MNNGIGSSGFIMTFLGALVAIAMFFLGGLSPEMTALLIACMTSIYTLSRAIIKASVSKKDDAVFNQIVSVLKPISEKLGVELKPIE